MQCLGWQLLGEVLMSVGRLTVQVGVVVVAINDWCPKKGCIF